MRARPVVRRGRLAAATVPLVAGALVLAGCSSSADGRVPAARTVSVATGKRACDLSPDRVAAGTARLAISNDGSNVTEVSVRRPDGGIVSERRNIGPGTSVDLVVELEAGRYTVRCRPGMRGPGIDAALRATRGVAGPTGAARADRRLAGAVRDYRSYLSTQVRHTIAATRRFVDAVEHGHLDRARHRYAPSRVGWGRIGPVAASFGDIEREVDMRAAGLAPGDTWTGWHRIEQALFARDTTHGMRGYGERLLADLADLHSRIPDARITPASMANGATDLLDEVAAGTVTGEEEAFSHTDLVDVEANVQGAQEVFGLLEPVVRENDPDLADTLQQRFAAVLSTLDAYRSGVGFVSYTTVGHQGRRRLADLVGSLAEPLSRLAAAVSR